MPRYSAAIHLPDEFDPNYRIYLAGRRDSGPEATADGRRHMTIPLEKRPSSRRTATISICCWVAEPTISGAAFGRPPRKACWRTL